MKVAVGSRGGLARAGLPTIIPSFPSTCPPSLLPLQELRSRYRPLEPAACQPLWEKAFEAADATDPKERPGAVARKRRLHILGGAVMRCWGAVQVSGLGSVGGR